MAAWVAKRLIAAVITVWVAVSIAFVALRVLPGNGVEAVLALSGASEGQIAERRAALGLDAPPLAQYFSMWGGYLRGDLGVSLVTGRAVSSMIGEQIGATLALAFAALVVGSAVGLILATGSAFGSPLSRAVAGGATLILMASPVYWTGTIAIYIFAVWLGLLPSAGNANDIRAWVLPVGVLGLSVAGGLSRVISTELRQTRRADFVRTAYAKGLSGRVVVWRHVLRASLSGAVALLTLQTGYLLGGAIVTEALFVRRGLGLVLLGAVNTQDYPVVQALVALSALIYSVVTVIGDLIGAALDPRLREDRG